MACCTSYTQGVASVQSWSTNSQRVLTVCITHAVHVHGCALPVAQALLLSQRASLTMEHPEGGKHGPTRKFLWESSWHTRHDAAKHMKSEHHRKQWRVVLQPRRFCRVDGPDDHTSTSLERASNCLMAACRAPVRCIAGFMSYDYIC